MDRGGRGRWTVRVESRCGMRWMRLMEGEMAMARGFAVAMFIEIVNCTVGGFLFLGYERGGRRREKGGLLDRNRGGRWGIEVSRVWIPIYLLLQRWRQRVGYCIELPVMKLAISEEGGEVCSSLAARKIHLLTEDKKGSRMGRSAEVVFRM